MTFRSCAPGKPNHALNLTAQKRRFAPLLGALRAAATYWDKRGSSLSKVQAFTLSHPLRWAFGYYAVC